MARRRKLHPVIVMYGHVKLERIFCADCGSNSFILDHHKVCCGAEVIERPLSFARESDGAFKRRKPERREQLEILKEQNYRCFYCGLNFGDEVYRNGEPVQVKLTWDHRLPYVLTLDNSRRNFVAACHICNSLKGALVFEDTAAAVDYIVHARRKKGYDF